jgi:hypothetical protein
VIDRTGPSPQTEAVHIALQRALSAIEAKADGNDVDLGGATLDELALFASALITLGATMAASFDKPHTEVIEALRMSALEAVDQ